MNGLMKRPYIYWIVGIFIIYIFANILVSGFYQKVPLYIKYSDTLNWTRIIVSIIFALTIGILVSLCSVTTYIKLKERQNCKREAFVTSIGTVGGMITGFCPLCVTGIIPLIFSFVGITFTFSSLPFLGLEVQFAVILLLFVNLYSLNKK